MFSGWLSFNCTPSVSSLITVSSVHRLRNCYICVHHELCNGNILYVWFVTVEGKSLFYSRVIYVINVPEEIEPGLCWALGRTASVCRNLVSSTGVRSHVWHLGAGPTPRAARMRGWWPGWTWCRAGTESPSRDAAPSSVRSQFDSSQFILNTINLILLEIKTFCCSSSSSRGFY